MLGELSEEVEAALDVIVIVGQNFTGLDEDQMALLAQLPGLENECVVLLQVLDQRWEVVRFVTAAVGVAEAD